MSIEKEKENIKKATYVCRESSKDSKTVFVFIPASKLRQFYSLYIYIYIIYIFAFLVRETSGI